MGCIPWGLHPASNVREFGALFCNVAPFIEIHLPLGISGLLWVYLPLDVSGLLYPIERGISASGYTWSPLDIVASDSQLPYTRVTARKQDERRRQNTDLNFLLGCMRTRPFAAPHLVVAAC